jgi:hypothetical protein
MELLSFLVGVVDIYFEARVRCNTGLETRHVTGSGTKQESTRFM